MRSIFCAATLLKRGVWWLPTMTKSTLYSFLMVGFLTLTLHLPRAGKDVLIQIWRWTLREEWAVPPGSALEECKLWPCSQFGFWQALWYPFAENKLDASVCWIEDLIFMSCYSADCPRAAFRWARGVIINKRVDTLVFTPPRGFEGISSAIPWYLIKFN